MDAQLRKDYIFGILILAVGLIYFALTLQVPAKEGVDARTVPFVLSGIFIALGALQLLLLQPKAREAARKKAYASSQGAAPSSAQSPSQATRPDTKTVALTALLILAYVLLLEGVGFLLTSAVYLFFQMSVLTPKDQARRYPLYAGIAVIASLVVYFTFRLCFDLLLPEGILG